MSDLSGLSAVFPAREGMKPRIWLILMELRGSSPERIPPGIPPTKRRSNDSGKRSRARSTKVRNSGRDTHSGPEAGGAHKSAPATVNVIHEAGLFQGRLGFYRAIVLLEEGCEGFSNIAGLEQIRFPPGNIGAVFEQIREVLAREELLAAASTRPTLHYSGRVQCRSAD